LVVADVQGDTARLDTNHPALLAWLHLGAAQETGTGAGITLRSVIDGGAAVQAWMLAADARSIHSRAEVFAAYCTDAETGEPVPPSTRFATAAPFRSASESLGSPPEPLWPKQVRIGEARRRQRRGHRLLFGRHGSRHGIVGYVSVASVPRSTFAGRVARQFFQ